MPDDEKPSPQVSPGKPGDGPQDSDANKPDKLSRSDDDDQHRQPGSD